MSSYRYKNAPLVVPQVIGPDGRPERVVSLEALDVCIYLARNLAYLPSFPFLFS